MIGAVVLMAAFGRRDASLARHNRLPFLKFQQQGGGT